MGFRHRSSRSVALVGFALLTIASGCSSSGDSSAANAPDSGDGKLHLVMIPKDTQATFWNQVRSGADRAAKEFDVELTWKGPATGNDRGDQKTVFQQFTNEGVDGILLAPTDGVALAPEVRAASAKGIPVLIFDSGIEAEQGKDYISYVATDNTAAGRLGGKHLMDLVGQGGKTVLFRHMEGHASTSAREEGALAEFQAAQANVLEQNRYSGRNNGEAQNTAINMIDVLREADGIFASNQTASEGLLMALRKMNLAGKVKFVGFDTSTLLVEGLAKGEIDALVVQDPVDMGYQSVKLMVEHLKNPEAKPEAVVNTGVHLITRENMNEPEMAALLK